MSVHVLVNVSITCCSRSEKISVQRVTGFQIVTDGALPVTGVVSASLLFTFQPHHSPSLSSSSSRRPSDPVSCAMRKGSSTLMWQALWRCLVYKMKKANVVPPWHATLAHHERNHSLAHCERGTILLALVGKLRKRRNKKIICLFIKKEKYIGFASNNVRGMHTSLTFLI